METKSMGFLILSVFLLVPGLSLWAEQEKPLTVSEKTEFKQTSRYKDVMSFIGELQEKSSLLRMEILGTSTEGRDIPLIIIGDPVPSSPLDLNYDDRIVVYFQANIHAGEVEGKEAALMLARDLVLSPDPAYLDKVVLLLAPIFNPDGNEKISADNRRNQVGPEEGVGVRYNGQNLDLNRDGLKLETPEVRGLVKNVMMRWDPVVLLDSHTHNGSYHQEVVTYVWSVNPNGDNSLIDFMSGTFMPEVNKILKEKYNIPCIPHGDFMSIEEPEKGWRSLAPEPRYVSNYIGLRNRLGILNENYPYADFKTRVVSCHKLFHSILEFCHQNKDEILELITQADKRTVKRGLDPGEDDFFITEYELNLTDQEITIQGYEMEVIETDRGWQRARKTDKKKTYTLPLYADYGAKSSVRLPYGYLIPIPVPEVEKNLLRHGITVEKLKKNIHLEVEKFVIEELKSTERPYQGHHLNTVKGKYVTEEVEFPEGTLFIPLAQPLANVASYLLEPESDDGLLVWNFFDRYIVPQWGRGTQVYPVYKLMEPVNLVKETVYPKK
ncbi:MAG: M14 family metallopeptidase [Acidobacteriota bacterium]